MTKSFEERFDEKFPYFKGSQEELRLKAFIRQEKELSRKEGYEEGIKSRDQEIWESTSKLQ